MQGLFPPSYLDALNPEQRDAVGHFEGPALVLAGAGSGKTRVLTTRIAHLVHEHGVAPERILAVTFTNKAAGEMRERIAGLLGGEPRGMWVGTFHALGARILRRHAHLLGFENTFTIFDADQALRQVKRTEESLGVDVKRFNPKAVRGLISDAKNRLVTPADFHAEHAEGFDLFARTVARVYPAYQGSLRQQQAMDFDDLLVMPVGLFEDHPAVLASYRDRFQFVLVDEYQDTNRAQFRFLELLASGHRNLMVVGDDDQSIYGWRGADVRNILDFETTFPGAHVVRLERNYRSTRVILEAANRVIAENRNRKGKTLRTEREGGEMLSLVECADETDEARTVVDVIRTRRDADTGPGRNRDFAVLYRTNAQSRALEDAFRRASIPYQIVGGVRFYERREIQDVLAYLRLVSNPRDEDAFLRIVNYPRRGIGDTSVERLRAFAAASGQTLLEAAATADAAGTIPPAAGRALREFAELIHGFAERARHQRVGELIEELIESLRLFQHLEDEGPDGEERVENVKELIAGALDFDAELVDDFEPGEIDGFSELDLFLQRVALVADVDRLDPTADTVTMMTLHNAKGLEFPVVFVTGLEDGLFPLSRSYDDPAQLEEERRLFYVGITRAEDKLVLTHARQRRRAGDMMFGRLSPFVEAIPDEVIVVERSLALSAQRTSTTKPGRTRGGFDTGDLDFEPDSAFEPSSQDQDAPRFVKGERVAHATFGSGSVVEVTGFGRDAKVTVDFDTVGRKRLIVRYAGLERDWTA